MDTSSEKTIEVNLHLNEKEARWLRSYMQNFMGSPDEVEGIESRNMREGLFCLLDEELEGT